MASPPHEITTSPFQRGTLRLQDVLAHLRQDAMVGSSEAQALLSGTTTRDNEHPLETIARQNWKSATRPEQPLTLEYLTEWLAGCCGLPYFRIDPLKLDLQAVTGVTSYAYAARYQFLPLYAEGDRLLVAVTQPGITDWIDTVAHVTGLRVERVLANPAEVRRYLGQFYRLSQSISGASGEDPRSTSANFEQFIELGDTEASDAEDQHIVNIVDWLLQYAFEQRASDIHIEPRREQGNLRFRIDGVMHLVNTIPANVMAGIISRLKILGRMDVSEKRRPQDGRIKTRTPQDREVELRASTMPTAFGEKLVLRIFDPDTVVKSLPELGFEKAESTHWQELITQPNGILLVSGPTGSGKTTTLYSTLKQLADPKVNVCTVEDPIEMVEPSFNQSQVQPAIGFGFAEGVRTLLRQDPDIIMVGEIRDRETADIAVQAALTGHLVLSTIHTNDAPSAITRLLELGMPPYLLNSTLLGVLAQRLVRRLCPFCKTAMVTDEDAWRALIAPFTSETPHEVNTASGCEECRGTGYMGRLGIYELMRLNNSLRSLITPTAELTRLRQSAIRGGTTPLRIAGARKVAAGHTSIEEVIRVVATAQGVGPPS